MSSPCCHLDVAVQILSYMGIQPALLAAAWFFSALDISSTGDQTSDPSQGCFLALNAL